MNKYLTLFFGITFLNNLTAPATPSSAVPVPSSDHIATIYRAAKNNQFDQMEAALTWKKKQGEKKYAQLGRALEYAIAQQDAKTTETLTIRLANETNWIARNPWYATALFTTLWFLIGYATSESATPKKS